MLSDRHSYFVYIVASRSRTLYIGVTNDLLRRVEEHREGTAGSFTAKYRVHRLVYFERFQYVGNAISREKQLKGWLRSRKVALVSERNPTWEDLYLELVGGTKAGPSLRSG